MFNTGERFPGQSIDNDLCQAVVRDNRVYPARTGLLVADLAEPEWLMEIDVTAEQQG